jgi:hypothetical protein
MFWPLTRTSSERCNTKHILVNFEILQNFNMKYFKAGYESVQGHVGASPYRTAGSDDITLGIHESCLLMMKRYLK